MWRKRRVQREERRECRGGTSSFPADAYSLLSSILCSFLLIVNFVSYLLYCIKSNILNLTITKI